MAKYEFKVGDRVQFKEWDEMGKEFGFCTNGDINTKCLFKKEMRHFCGTYATIADLIPFAGRHLVILCNFTATGHTCWNITPDMLKPASTKKQTVDEPKTKEAYGFKHGDKVKYRSMVCTVVGKHKTAFNTLTIKLPDGKGGHNAISSEQWEKFEGRHYWFVFADRLTRVVDKPTTHECPTITAHTIEGKKTTVTLSNGDKGMARCNPNDKFDAYTGLKLATERAYGITAKEEPQVKEVNRAAKVGEYIKIVNPIFSFGNYKNGDILNVIISNPITVTAKNIPIRIRHEEYVVLENYKPEGNEKPKLKFKEGDCVFVRNATIGCQGANGYRGKVTNSEATNGLLKYCVLDTTNVRLENGRVWRVNTDGLEFEKSTL